MTAKIVKLKKQVPPAPAHLSARAKAQWETLAPGLMARGLLTPENTDLIAAYCGELAMLAEFGEILAREGLTVTGKDGVTRPHPCQRPRAMASQRVIQFGKRLGMFSGREAPGADKATAKHRAFGIR